MLEQDYRRYGPTYSFLEASSVTPYHIARDILIGLFAVPVIFALNIKDKISNKRKNLINTLDNNQNGTRN